MTDLWLPVEQIQLEALPLEKLSQCGGDWWPEGNSTDAYSKRLHFPELKKNKMDNKNLGKKQEEKMKVLCVQNVSTWLGTHSITFPEETVMDNTC